MENSCNCPTCGCACTVEGHTTKYYVPQDLSAEQLKDKYEADLKYLQQTCKHEKISQWLPYYWAPAHYSHDVRQCVTCWKVIEERRPHYADILNVQ
jgi:hypothetical protein